MKPLIVALLVALGLSACGSHETVVVASTPVVFAPTLAPTTTVIEAEVTTTTTTTTEVPTTTVEVATTQPSPVETVPTIPAVSPHAATWAFCGVSPYDPFADAKTRTLAQVAGIDATFGPCLPPDWSTYTTANPGVRYQSVTDYMLTVQLNAKYGMGTLVYDARVWDTDPAVRQQAFDYWAPVMSSITAWDMGDEFDPNYGDWAILVARWNIMKDITEPATGVAPFTNHMPQVLAQAMTDLKGQGTLLSYDAYDQPTSLAIAAEWAPKANDLMCAINALDHGDFHPTPEEIVSQMKAHMAAGCDSFLIFGGEQPFAGDDQQITFASDSLVTDEGQPTNLAAAVKSGSN